MALAPCPDCGKLVSPNAKACPRCGAPLRPSRQWGCGTTLLLLLGSGVAYVWIVNTTLVPSDPLVDKAIARQSIHIGDVVTLDDGDSMCALAADAAAWDEMVAIQVAGGSLAPLVEEGRVFPAPRGSQAKVVNGGFTSVRVQLLDGPFAGNLGWIQRECVRK